MGPMQMKLLNEIEKSMRLKENGMNIASVVTLQEACVEAARDVNEYISPESKMNISTAVSVLKNDIERYDEQMKMHGIMGGDLLDENPTISAMRKAVEILENIKIVYQKTVIPNELYRDGNIEHVKKGSAIGMADELINYIEFKDRYILELDQKEIVGKLMIVDMCKGAKNE